MIRFFQGLMMERPIKVSQRQDPVIVSPEVIAEGHVYINDQGKKPSDLVIEIESRVIPKDAVCLQLGIKFIMWKLFDQYVAKGDF